MFVRVRLHCFFSRSNTDARFFLLLSNSAPPTGTSTGTNSGDIAASEAFAPPVTPGRATTTKQLSKKAGTTVKKTKKPTQTPRRTATKPRAATTHKKSRAVATITNTIEPHFSIYTRELFKSNKDVLVIGNYAGPFNGDGAGHWLFDLESHLLAIAKANPGLDLYIVGYGHEERPELPVFVGKDPTVTNVPFFCVHALPQDTPAPRSLVLNDMLQNDQYTTAQEIQLISDSSLKWKHVSTLHGETRVYMLDSSAVRLSKRSLNTLLSKVLTCGRVWFPCKVQFDDVNPGDDLTFHYNGETFYFDYDSFDE